MRQRRRGGAAGRGRSAEQPRTDEQGVSAEGREQPPVEPTVETVPAPVEDVPDTTMQEPQVEGSAKPEESGEEEPKS